LEEIAKIIDHTALAAEAGAGAITRLCGEAKEYGFRSVVVQPCRVSLAVEALSGSGIPVGTVAGFPFGAAETEIKAEEASLAIGRGATEIDMVINVGWIKDGRWEQVAADIREVGEACRSRGPDRKVILKVIIEACLLTDDEKGRAAAVVKEAGADYVKTSTGYLGPGANPRDVALMRKAVGPGFGIKASGGIRTLAQAKELLNAGADIIGTSAGAAIMNEHV